MREKVYFNNNFQKKRDKGNDENNVVVEWRGSNKFKQDDIKDEEDEHDEEKENKLKDYVNTHKMLLELDNIDKEDKGKSESEEIIEDHKKWKEEYFNIKIDDIV